MKMFFLNGANKRESRRGEDPGKEQIYMTRASKDSLGPPWQGQAEGARQFPVSAQWGQSSANGAHIQRKWNKVSEGPKDVVHCHQARSPPRVNLSPFSCCLGGGVSSTL